MAKNIQTLQNKVEEQAVQMNSLKNQLKQKDQELKFYKIKMSEQKQTITNLSHSLNEASTQNEILLLKLELYEKKCKLLQETISYQQLDHDILKISEVQAICEENQHGITSQLQNDRLESQERFTLQQDLSEIVEKFSEEFQTHSTQNKQQYTDSFYEIPSQPYQDILYSNDSPAKQIISQISIEDQEDYLGNTSFNYEQFQNKEVNNKALVNPSNFLVDISNRITSNNQTLIDQSDNQNLPQIDIVKDPENLTQQENIQNACKNIMKKQQKPYVIGQEYKNNRNNMKSLSSKLKDQSIIKQSVYFTLDQCIQRRDKLNSMYHQTVELEIDNYN